MSSREEIKDAVRIRDGYRCTKCGMTAAEHRRIYGKTLDVHRIVPGSLYTAEGCVTICRRCHGSQPKRQRGQPDLASNTFQVGVPLELYEALRRYAQAHSDEDLTRSISWAGRRGLEKFLETEGFWPPPTKE